MHVQASTVQPGDRVRGIGLVVDFAEPADDFHTNLVGKVSTAPNPAAGYDPSGEWQLTDTKVTLPNNHIVNVARHIEPATEEFGYPDHEAAAALKTFDTPDVGTSNSAANLALMPLDQFQAEFDAVTNDEWDGDVAYYNLVISEAQKRGITA